MAETRARRRIRQAVESRGYRVESLEWEPWYDAGEMSGLAGGWMLILDRPYLGHTHPGDDLCALSVEELLGEIDYWLKPEGECACDRRHSSTLAARLIGDPQRPTHGPECQFHIRYRLPWWPKTGESSDSKPSDSIGCNVCGEALPDAEPHVCKPSDSEGGSES